MAGFEGADHVNGAGQYVDMARLTQHDRELWADYERLREFGISTARESAGWRLVERNGCFDFSHLQRCLDAARACDMQILWTLCHYGWPDDVDVFSDAFIDRFARYCGAIARFFADSKPSGDSAVYTPINEISFLTWAICESSLIYPHRGMRAHDAYELKKRLVRAALAGSEAIWEIDPHARVLNTDPIVHIIAPPDRPELAADAQRQCDFQFQAWDMLCGKCEPQLGGSPRHLDLVGVNYYHSNQWEYATYESLHWHLRDTRRVSLSALIRKVHERYGHPLLVSETSHVGSGRGPWIREVAEEVTANMSAGLPVLGICLYPIVDRPGWDDHGHWHNSGLWDVCFIDGKLERLLCVEYARDLRAAQRLIDKALQSRER